MKYFLRKRDNEFWLESRSENHCTVIAEQEPDVNDLTSKLSIKNCQAIERGYDLNELVEQEFSKFDQEARIIYRRQLQESLANMFKKALEILGDKKFSEADVINIAEYVRVASQSSPSVRTKDLFNEYQSLQKTEWEVEIITEEGKDTFGNAELTWYNPKLDADGCLILKRK